jgi:hypothetical protein
MAFPAGVETLIFSISNVVIQAAANQLFDRFGGGGQYRQRQSRRLYFLRFGGFRGGRFERLRSESMEPIKRKISAKPFSIRFRSSRCWGLLLGGIAAFGGPLIDILIKDSRPKRVSSSGGL